LGFSLPSEDVDLGEIDHPLMAETRRLAPLSPEGQKRILAIDDRLVYRVQFSDRRGATWVDEENQIVWLLGAGDRREGSAEDAYVYFAELHKAGRLLPTAEDYLRDQVEGAARILSRIAEEAREFLRQARAQTGTELAIVLVESIEARLYVELTEGLEEIWLAVSTRDRQGRGVNLRLRDLIFVSFEQAAGGAEWEPRADWPTEELRWFEVARLGVQSV
jgi:hypothetical protein